MKKMSRLRHSRGFTLIEVMVALAVVAVALPALMFSLHQQIDGTAYLRDKSVARMVAANKLSEISIMAKARRQLLKGKDSGSTEMAGRQWDWSMNTTETVVPNFYRIEITVNAQDVDDGTALYTLIGSMSADLRVEVNSGGTDG